MSALMDRLPEAAVAVVVAVGAALAYIIAAEWLGAPFPNPIQPRIRPWLWLAPAAAFLLVFLVFPAINTVVLSFRNADSSSWVGLGNYAAVLGDSSVRTAIRNNLIWVLVFPTLTVGLGLGIALLA